MGPVLVDTNVLLEGHNIGCWAALAGGFLLETVEECVRETQTGFQRRSPEKQINEQALRGALHAVHEVTDQQRAQVLVKGGWALDAGERDLWAHALTRTDTWILCGPDRASMRFGYENGARERLVSLGELLTRLRFTPSAKLRPHFEKYWLDTVMQKLILGQL